MSAISGISEFLGKVLGQLSLSSWLPAVMLVGNLAILVKLREQIANKKGLSVGAALTDLTGSALGTLTVLLFAVLLGTMITQAFEFEIIRLLEGYFAASWGPTRWFATYRIWRHTGKRKKLLAKWEGARNAAFDPARDAMLRLDNGFDRRLLNVLDDHIHGRKQATDVTDDELLEAQRLPWTSFATSQTLYRLDALERRVESYPAQTRLLPSRLGNVLRSAEDGIDLPEGESLVGFVLRYNDDMPATLQEEHRAYRTRLEMYCSLVPVCLAMAAAAGGLLEPRVWPTIGSVAAYLLLGWVSYEAAVASARGYGDVLGEIDVFRKRLSNAADEEPAGDGRWVRLRKFLHRHVMHGA